MEEDCQQFNEERRKGETENNSCSPVGVSCAHRGFASDPERGVRVIGEFFLLHITSELSEMGECVFGVFCMSDKKD